MQLQSVPFREELRAVSRPVLEEYVGARLKQFSQVFANVLRPGVTEQAYEYAYSRTLQLLGANAQETRLSDSYILRFSHRCRFLGCMRKECALCQNNPNKKCREDDNFDECYADGQVLKSKCEADVYLELVNLRTGATEAMPGIDIAVSVLDGDSYSDSTAGNYSHVKELLKNDDESILLGAYQAGSKTEPDGRLYLRMTEGQVKLPDVCITDKNDTFHLNGETFGTFRLMARAVRREGHGQLATLENIRPAVSGRFIVKTQRALNDYRKSEYPHFKDELTKLKHIGSITAQRLREIQQHLDCPYGSIETVEQLKQLMQYADQNRQVENKMLELLNMKGKHKHKWDYLREVLAERVVYDDMLHRLWYTDDTLGQGVLFSCKQGQINMERPVGLAQRLPNGRLVVSSSPTGQEAETLKQWRSMAETAWHTPGHRGWMILHEQLEMASAGGSVLLGGTPTLSMGGNGSVLSMADGIEDQVMVRRGSVGITPMMLESARSHRASTVGYNPGPSSPEQGQQGLYGMHSVQQSSGSFTDNSMQKPSPGALQQQTFQFMGRSVAPQALMAFGLAANDIGPDVYRTASAPNVAASSSPLFSHNSLDSSAAHSGLMGAPSGPPGMSGSPNDAVLPPPPTRGSRYRRLSADTGAVRQHTQGFAQPGVALQTIPDLSPDLTGKRTRVPAPGPQLLEELELQQQQQAAAVLESQRSPPSRVTLYHFESRGRHTPRSRLSHEMTDTVAAGNTPYGGVLDGSDIDTYLASQNFTFVTGDQSYPTSAAGEQRPCMGPVHNAGIGIASSNHSSIPTSLLQLNMLQSEQLTGQMQQTLILNDPGMGVSGQSGPVFIGMEHNHHSQSSMNHAGYVMGSGASAGGGGPGMGPRTQRADSLQRSDSLPNHGVRELKHCESDSFKRFLANGLPFAPMEGTPEDLLEGLRTGSGFLDDGS